MQHWIMDQPEQIVPLVYDDDIWKHIDEPVNFYCDKNLWKCHMIHNTCIHVYTCRCFPTASRHFAPWKMFMETLTLSILYSIMIFCITCVIAFAFYIHVLIRYLITAMTSRLRETYGSERSESPWSLNGEDSEQIYSK